MRAGLTERFESRIEREPMSGCWLWTGAQDGHGYGHMWMDDRVEKAHRISWRLFRGEIPSAQWVLHRCDTPVCVNPSHLFLGDRAANMQDMARKGRQVFQATPSKINRGEQAPGAKLTETQAREVVERLNAGESLAAVARRFGVSKPTIGAIRTGRTWAFIDRANPRADITVRPIQRGDA